MRDEVQWLLIAALCASCSSGPPPRYVKGSLEGAVYANRKSLYRQLLAHAGIELADVAGMTQRRIDDITPYLVIQR